MSHNPTPGRAPGSGAPPLLLALFAVWFCPACSPKHAGEPPPARTGEGMGAATGPVQPATAPAANAQEAGFAMLVVEDRAGQLAVKSGHVGELTRLGPAERQSVMRAWQHMPMTPRGPGVYCGRLLDPSQRQAAVRCVQPRSTAHLAPRKAGDPAVEKPVGTIAFALRLPWPVTATSGGWTLEIGAHDGRTATWRPR